MLVGMYQSVLVAKSADQPHCCRHRLDRLIRRATPDWGATVKSPQVLRKAAREPVRQERRGSARASLDAGMSRTVLVGAGEPSGQLRCRRHHLTGRKSLAHVCTSVGGDR